MKKEFDRVWRPGSDRTAPLRYRRPTVVRVRAGSPDGDLFHPDVPDGFVDRVFAVMAMTGRHFYQILTERPERMTQYFSGLDGGGPWNRSRGWDYLHGVLYQMSGRAQPWPLPNVWLGTSIENDDVTERVRTLSRVPAVVRFLSVEPLLGPLDLDRCACDGGIRCCGCGGAGVVEVDDVQGDDDCRDCRGTGSLIDWVVIGGQIGPHALPMHPQWARDIRDQCAAAGVAFWFTGWGEWVPYDNRVHPLFDPQDAGEITGSKIVRMREDGALLGHAGGWHQGDEWMYRAAKHAASRLLDGVEHNGFPTVTAVEATRD